MDKLRRKFIKNTSTLGFSAGVVGMALPALASSKSYAAQDTGPLQYLPPGYKVYVSRQGWLAQPPAGTNGFIPFCPELTKYWRIDYLEKQDTYRGYADQVMSLCMDNATCEDSTPNRFLQAPLGTELSWEEFSEETEELGYPRFWEWGVKSYPPEKAYELYHKILTPAQFVGGLELDPMYRY